MNGLFRARIILDEVGPPDADALVAIHGDAFARSWSSDDFAALIADRTVFALALRRQGVFSRRRLVGFALVRSVAGEAEILTVAVAPADRGLGFGRRLMEEALRRLYREGAAACFLEVDEANVAAVRLYRSLGFEVVGKRKGYYRTTVAGEGTALVMRVQLR
jgi:ribosomal-protein-alanine N-acetyltransferase